MTQTQFRGLQQQLDRAQKILLAVHEHPDGDALGSMLALAEHLRSRGLAVTAFSHDPVPLSFQFLPGSQTVTQAPPDLAAFDAVVLLDCGDVRRTHLPLDQRESGRPVVVNLDHHPTRTTLRGQPVVDLNLVETHVSSTSELVYEYLLTTQAPITKSMATCLLTGICTDTGTFQNLATTETCLVAAARLLLQGANLPKIIQAINRNKSVGMLKLWGRALTRLKKDEANGLVTTVIRLADLEECGVEDTEGLANFLNSLGEARVVLVLQEEADGSIRGSFRTTRPDVNVEELAKAYGGGGHVKAAGFTVRGRLEETPRGWRIVRVQ